MTQNKQNLAVRKIEGGRILNLSTFQTLSISQDLPEKSVIGALCYLPKDNVAPISKLENLLTMEKAMEYKNPLAVYNSENQYGLKMKAEIRLAMLKAIDYTLTFFPDSVHKLDVTQAIELVNILLKDFYYIKLEEVLVVLRNGKIGKYGQIYNRVDANMIYGWFEAYQKERFEYAENKSITEHQKLKSEKTITATNEEMMQMYLKAHQERFNEPTNTKTAKELTDAEKRQRARDWYLSELAKKK